LSVIERIPATLPEAAGVKVTFIVQFDPGARGALQVSVSAKFVAVTMLVILSGAVPELVTVTDRG
jgi:hypothetical protein